MLKIFKKSSILNFILLLSFLVFPLGQIPKLTVYNGIKISLLDILIAVYLTVGFLQGFRFNRDKIGLKLPGLLFITFSLTSLLTNSPKFSTETLLLGFSYLIRFSLYFFFYLQISWFTSPKQKRLIDYGLLFSGFLVAVFGIFQYLLYPDLRNLLYLGWDPHYYRLFSTFFDPNFTGVILVLTLFQFIFFRFNSIFFLITSVALYLTYSRSALIALISGLTVLLLTIKKIKKEIILVFLIATAFFFLIPKPPLDVLDLFRSVTSTARIKNWQQSWQIGLTSPLFGHGFGTVRFADASFLYVLANTGFLGLFFYSWLWQRIFSFALSKNSKVLIVATVLFISSWFNNTLFYPWIWYWFLLFLASQKVTVRRKQ